MAAGVDSLIRIDYCLTAVRDLNILHEYAVPVGHEKYC